MIDDFILCSKRFATTRNTENELVAVQKLSAVCDDHILGNDILPIVNTIGMANVLHPEGDKDSKALGGQGAEGVDVPNAKGHRRVHSVKLLEFENTELAQMLSCSGKQSFGVIIELFLRVGGMNHRQDSKHHSLVTGGQVIKELLHFLALLFNVVRKLRRKVVVGVLPALPVGCVGFHAQQTTLRFSYSFVRRYGNNINGHHQIAVQIGHFGHHTVLDIRGILSQKQHSAVAFAEFEIVREQLNRVRTDEILEVVTLSAGFLDVKAKLRFFTGTVKVVENAKPFVRLQLHALTAQSPKMSDQVCANTGKVISRFLHILLADRDGDILLLNDGVCAGGFLQKHPIVLLTVLVQRITFEGKKNGLLKIRTVQTAVVDGDLRGCAAVKGIEQLGIFKEHCFLVRTAGYGVIDVAELIGLGELISADLKDAVVINHLNRDHILNASRHNKPFFILLEQVAKCLNHWLSIPPSVCVPYSASSFPSRCWWNGRSASWASETRI